MLNIHKLGPQPSGLYGHIHVSMYIFVHIYVSIHISVYIHSTCIGIENFKKEKNIWEIQKRKPLFI